MLKRPSTQGCQSVVRIQHFRQTVRLSFLAFLLLLLSSCIIPVQQTLTVGEDLTGTIIDEETKVGIPEAKIRYTLIDGYYPTSDSAGVFTIEPKELEKTYWMPPAPVCPPPWSWENSRYEIEISADGYEGRIFERIKYRIVAPSPDLVGPTERDESYLTFELIKRKKEKPDH